MNIKIFASEINDGLENILKSTASICYASVAEPCVGKKPSFKTCRAMASLNDEDLYYVQSILVTSSWNKNDDIFDKLEVWNARNTPEDKPTNLEHDESVIIGHITSNWPISESGEIIDQNIDINDIPNKYHILTGSVIYRGFTNPDLRSRAEQLISEIEQGQKYVSMECFFKGFDYGLINKTNGEYKILQRNEETAYLTKYLKAYGGLGEHQNYKIGRVLRNITFSGKGFVSKPANPESVIFNENLISEDVCENLTEKNDNLTKSGVSINQLTSNAENNIMSSENQTVAEEVKTEVAPVTDVVDTSTEAMQKGMPELEAAMNDKQKELDTLKSAYDTLKMQKEEEMAVMKKEMAEKEDMWNKQNSELNSTIENMQASLKEANDTIAAFKSKEEEMKKKEKKAKRLAALIEVGVANTLAATTVDKFELLDDETFAAMTSLFTVPKTESNETSATEEVIEKEEASVNSTDPAVLETAEVEADVNLSVGGETESTIETTRAALVEYVSSILGKKL